MLVSSGNPTPFQQVVAPGATIGSRVCLDGTIVMSQSTANLLTDFTVSLACGAPSSLTPTSSAYLTNITKTLGRPTGWQTPFIVQNTGSASTDLEVSLYAFSDGTWPASLRGLLCAISLGLS